MRAWRCTVPAQDFAALQCRPHGVTPASRLGRAGPSVRHLATRGLARLAKRHVAPTEPVDQQYLDVTVDADRSQEEDLEQEEIADLQATTQAAEAAAATVPEAAEQQAIREAAREATRPPPPPAAAAAAAAATAAAVAAGNSSRRNGAAAASVSGNGTAATFGIKSHPIGVDGSGVQSHPIDTDGDYFAAQELAQELLDKEQFGSRGEGWFFAQLAVIALVVFPPMPLQGLIDFLGTLSLTAGCVFIVYALLSLGRNLSPMPAPRKKHKLVVTGMYSYVRHPMYSGLLLASLGLAAVTHSEIRIALAALLWYILEQKIQFEERELIARYPEYNVYISKVKKLIPFVY